MAINLEKGHRINLEKTDGKKLTEFCVGVNWGAIVREVPRKSGFLGLSTKMVAEELDVDIDLSCVMTDAQGNLIDTLYSPLYNPVMFRSRGLPVGKDWSADGSMYHTPDDTEGDKGGDDGLDNEIVQIDLKKVRSNIDQIFFFLNIFSPRSIDFAEVPYVQIRMFEGTPQRVQQVFAQYDVAKEPQFRGKNALVLGRIYRRNGEWKFAAIGDAFDDGYDLRNTIKRILDSYAK
jgi:tellurium resistance protein TerZ